MESKTQVFEALTEPRKESIHLTGPWRQVCGLLGQGGVGDTVQKGGGTAKEDPGEWIPTNKAHHPEPKPLDSGPARGRGALWTKLIM